MYLQSHIYKNIPVSFDFIKYFNSRSVFVFILYKERLSLKMLEHLYGKRCGSKIALANRKECEKVTLLPIGCAMLHAALHTVSFVHGCFAGKCIVTGSTE
jgi:hypothetical protein